MLTEQAPIREQALKRLSARDIPLVVENALKIGEGLAPSVKDLLNPENTALLPTEIGYAFPKAGQIVILQVDPHTQVVLEGRSQDKPMYSVFVDGQPRLGAALEHPVVLGRNPQFNLRRSLLSRMAQADPIAIDQATDDTALLLTPAQDAQGQLGYLVANRSTRIMSIGTDEIEIITAPQRAISDLPPLDAIDSHERKNSPLRVYSAEYVEAKGSDHPCEDVVVTANNGRTMIVLDGMGGQGNGNIAAEVAKHAIASATHFIPSDAPVNVVADLLEQTLHSAHGRVNTLPTSYVRTPYGVQEARPGATVVIGHITYTPEGPQLVVAWAGDSRAYIQYPDGTVKQLTVDDSIQQSYAASGEKFVSLQRGNYYVVEDYDPKNPDHKKLTPYTLTPEETNAIDEILDVAQDPADLKTWTNNDEFNKKLTIFYRVRNRVMNHIGGGISDSELQVHTKAVKVPSGSRIWYTTDGVTDPLPRGQLVTEFREALVGISEGTRRVNPLDPPIIPASRENLRVRLANIVSAVRNWNTTHSNGRAKPDDMSLAVQLVYAD